MGAFREKIGNLRSMNISDVNFCDRITAEKDDDDDDPGFLHKVCGSMSSREKRKTREDDRRPRASAEQNGTFRPAFHVPNGDIRNIYNIVNVGADYGERNS